MPKRIHTIITHQEFHVDEVVAVCLLQALGKEKYSGLGEADIQFRRPDEREMAGRTPEQMEDDGILMIGTGGGHLDEHAVGDKARDEGHSAASLVAELLGCADNPIYKGLIDYVTHNDLNGKTVQFEWAAMLKDMHATYPGKKAAMVWNWAVMYVDAYIEQQKAYYVEAKKELSRAKVIRHNVDGSHLKIVSLQSDARKLKARAFSAAGGYNAVVVQRNFRGHIQVFTNPSHRLDITQVVAEIRKAELIKRGGTPDPAVDYTVGETMKAVSAWHFFLEGNMAFNGSFTAPETSPSRLSLQEVTDLVVKYIRKQPRQKASKTPEGELAMSGADRA